MTKEIDNKEDILDIRDIIERFEELEAEFDSAMETSEAEEFTLLQSLLEELKGNGGDEQWKGDWYPVTLIRESYFEDYIEELITDCGYISRDFPSWIKIDWEETAENVKVDYSEVEIDGVTYYYR